MIIRSKTFKGWLRANFKNDELRDMVNCGVSGGFHGLTYYTDTVKLYERFNVEIWDSLYDEAEAQGYSIPELIATFNGAKNVGDDRQFKNLLVWYMAEETARELLGEDK